MADPAGISGASVSKQGSAPSSSRSTSSVYDWTPPAIDEEEFDKSIGKLKKYYMSNHKLPSGFKQYILDTNDADMKKVWKKERIEHALDHVPELLPTFKMSYPIKELLVVLRHKFNKEVDGKTKRHLVAKYRRNFGKNPSRKEAVRKELLESLPTLDEGATLDDQDLRTIAIDCMRMPTEETPYESCEMRVASDFLSAYKGKAIFCPICPPNAIPRKNFKFKDARAFTHHLLKIHSNAGCKTYACTDCFEAFVQREAFNTHKCKGIQEENNKEVDRGKLELKTCYLGLACSDCGIYVPIRAQLNGEEAQREWTEILRLMRTHSTLRLHPIWTYSERALERNPVVYLSLKNCHMKTSRLEKSCECGDTLTSDSIEKLHMLECKRSQLQDTRLSLLFSECPREGPQRGILSNYVHPLERMFAQVKLDAMTTRKATAEQWPKHLLPTEFLEKEIEAERERAQEEEKNPTHKGWIPDEIMMKVPAGTRFADAVFAADEASDSDTDASDGDADSEKEDEAGGYRPVKWSCVDILVLMDRVPYKKSVLATPDASEIAPIFSLSVPTEIPVNAKMQDIRVPLTENGIVWSVYACPPCRKLICGVQCVEQHMRRCNTDTELKVQVHNLQANAPNARVSCFKCSRLFCSIAGLMQHLALQHGEQYELDLDSAKTPTIIEMEKERVDKNLGLTGGKLESVTKRRKRLEKEARENIRPTNDDRPQIQTPSVQPMAIVPRPVSNNAPPPQPHRVIPTGEFLNINGMKVFASDAPMGAVKFMAETNPTTGDKSFFEIMYRVPDPANPGKFILHPPGSEPKEWRGNPPPFHPLHTMQPQPAAAAPQLQPSLMSVPPGTAAAAPRPPPPKPSLVSKKISRREGQIGRVLSEEAVATTSKATLAKQSASEPAVGTVAKRPRLDPLLTPRDTVSARQEPPQGPVLSVVPELQESMNVDEPPSLIIDEEAGGNAPSTSAAAPVTLRKPEPPVIQIEDSQEDLVAADVATTRFAPPPAAAAAASCSAAATNGVGRSAQAAAPSTAMEVDDDDIQIVGEQQRPEVDDAVEVHFPQSDYIDKEGEFRLCRFCLDITPMDEETFKLHTDNHVKRLKQPFVSCNSCAFLIPAKDLEKHMQAHKRLKMEFVCAECNKMFWDDGYYYSHLHVVHEHDIIYFCKRCGYATKQSEKAVIHAYHSDCPCHTTDAANPIPEKLGVIAEFLIDRQAQKNVPMQIVGIHDKDGEAHQVTQCESVYCKGRHLMSTPTHETEDGRMRYVGCPTDHLLRPEFVYADHVEKGIGRARTYNLDRQFMPSKPPHSWITQVYNVVLEKIDRSKLVKREKEKDNMFSYSDVQLKIARMPIPPITETNTVCFCGRKNPTIPIPQKRQQLEDWIFAYVSTDPRGKKDATWSERERQRLLEQFGGRIERPKFCIAHFPMDRLDANRQPLPGAMPERLERTCKICNKSVAPHEEVMVPSREDVEFLVKWYPHKEYEQQQQDTRAQEVCQLWIQKAEKHPTFVCRGHYSTARKAEAAAKNKPAQATPSPTVQTLRVPQPAPAQQAAVRISPSSGQVMQPTSAQVQQNAAMDAHFMQTLQMNAMMQALQDPRSAAYMQQQMQQATQLGSAPAASARPAILRRSAPPQPPQQQNRGQPTPPPQYTDLDHSYQQQPSTSRPPGVPYGQQPGTLQAQRAMMMARQQQRMQNGQIPPRYSMPGTMQWQQMQQDARSRVEPLQPGMPQLQPMHPQGPMQGMGMPPNDPMAQQQLFMQQQQMHQQQLHHQRPVVSQPSVITAQQLPPAQAPRPHMPQQQPARHVQHQGSPVNQPNGMPQPQQMQPVQQQRPQGIQSSAVQPPNATVPTVTVTSQYPSHAVHSALQQAPQQQERPMQQRPQALEVPQARRAVNSPIDPTDAVEPGHARCFLCWRQRPRAIFKPYDNPAILLAKLLGNDPLRLKNATVRVHNFDGNFNICPEHVQEQITTGKTKLLGVADCKCGKPLLPIEKKLHDLHGNLNITHLCLECFGVFSSEKEALLHLTKCQDWKIPSFADLRCEFLCPLNDCNHPPLTSSYYLNKHIREYHSNEMHKSTECTSYFKDPSAMTEHAKLHEKHAAIHCCPVCGTCDLWTEKCIVDGKPITMNHMHAHTLEMTYYCTEELCRVNKGLEAQDHFITNHTRSNEEGTFCKICDADLGTNGSRSHSERHLFAAFREKQHGEPIVARTSNATKAFMGIHFKK